MVENKCPMCGLDSFDVVYDTRKSMSVDAPISYQITCHSADQEVRVVRCRHCELSFLNPRPEQNTVIDSYVNMIDEKYLQEEQGRRASARYILKYLRNIKADKGTLLDIGCAAGFFLDEARKDGWDVYGVEMSKWAVDHAKNNLGLKNIFQGLLSDAKLPKNFFDAVVMTDVIEHLIEPRAVLEEIRPILKAKGVLCCNTPDIGSLMSRVLGAKWWGIKQAHLFYFNKFTLNQLLTASGFHVTKVRSHARTFSLGYWVSNFVKYKPSLKFYDEFLKKFPRLAAIMLSVNLGDQIEMFARKSRQLKYINEMEVQTGEVQDPIKQKVFVVLPAYNAAQTLQKTLRDIPKDIVEQIILVDDCSKDNTVEVARNLGIAVFSHQKNTGYGGNQKTCYQKALEMGADIVVMVHPDYQYDPTAIPQLIEPIIKGRADAVFGSRMMKGGALEGGMPTWKYNANILLTALENVVLGIYLTEYHTGFRAYSRKYLMSVDFKKNSDGFVFDTEIIIQGVLKFLKFEEVPIRTRYFDEASSIKLWPSIVYGVNILKSLLKFVLHKNGWKFKQFE